MSFKNICISFVAFTFLILLFVTPACTPKFTPNASPKDIYMVYGVLKTTDTAQYIRIFKAFLIEGNSIDYAKDHDVSVKGLKVQLVGNNKTYTATQVDNVPTVITNPLNGGAFYPTTTLYKINTKGTNILKEATKYTLNITDPNDQGLSFTAHTTIPATPKITTPSYVTAAGTYQGIRLENLLAPYLVKWASKSLSDVVGFELRSYLYFEKNGQKDTAVYETAMLTNGQGNGCQVSSSDMCYLFGAKELLQYFKTKMPEKETVNGSTVTNTYTYKNTPVEAQSLDNLPKSLRFEVTALDTFLTRFFVANNPAFVDFNSVKPEYTNLSGTKDVYGIFGSVNKSYFTDKNNGYILLDQCGEYLLGLNGATKPIANPCEW